jgi:hypothetical protein
MISAMKDIQSTYGGGNITQPQLEAVFRKWLPTPSASCNARLTQFYAQWWNTSFPSGGANTLNRPMLTGPGLNGQGFPCAKVTPAAPNGQGGWYTTDVAVDWSGFPTPAATITATRTGCGDASGHESITTDGTFTPSCSVSSVVTATSANAGTSGPISETIKRDATPPEVTYTGNAGTYTVDQDVSITCAASDATSGVDSSTCEDISGPAYSFGLGHHTFSASATDVAGNSGFGSTSFDVIVTFDSLANLVDRFSTSDDVTAGLTNKLAAAATAKNAKTRANQLDAFENQVNAQTGKALTAAQAALLISLAEALK